MDHIAILLRRLRSCCEEAQRGLALRAGTLSPEDELALSKGHIRTWDPDYDGFESMIADIDAALLLAEPQSFPRVPLAPWQIAVARAYDGGEFAYLIDDPDWYGQLDLLGDSLFKFLMLELSAGEDCDTLEIASLRLGTAMQQIAACLAALSRCPEESSAHA